jgi:hypothetical protein
MESPDATPRLGSSMFGTYLIAQKKQHQAEHQIQEQKKNRKALSMRHSRDQKREDNARSSSLAHASHVLLSDDDDNDDDADESNGLDDAAALEAAVMAARSIQSRGRRTPLQDALIHRSLPPRAFESCALPYTCWDAGLQCRKLVKRCKQRMMELKSFWNWKFLS